MPDDGRLFAVSPSAPAMRPRQTTADLIAAYLQVEGVDTVFGVPGGPIMGMFDALARSTHIRAVLCKHEQGAAFAAFGYASVSRRLSVVAVTSGPGLTNTLSALASAYQDRVPILVLAGQVATTSIGRGAAQDSSVVGIDVMGMASPVSALSVSASSAEQTLAVLPTLIRTALCRRRPVVLQLPADVLLEPVPDGLPMPGCYRIGTSVAFDVEAAKRAWPILTHAKRPAVLLGTGARTTPRATLVRLAEALGAAVATTPRAKGFFPEDHPLSVGVFGFAGSLWARRALLESEVDVLVVLGSSLGELASDGWNPCLQAPTLLHVDIDPAAICVTYPATGIVGDVAGVVSYWDDACTRLHVSPPPHPWVEEIKRSCDCVANPKAVLATSVPLAPERVFGEIDACIPLDARLVCDTGNSMAYALHYLQLRGSQELLTTLGFACMGQATGMALGAFLADPDRPVIALIGDAAFATAGFEVHTAAQCQPKDSRYGGPIFIVLNDSSNDSGHRRFDICQIARGFGVPAIRVRKPGQLASALSVALGPSRGASVIEVLLTPDARLSHERAHSRLA